MMKAIITVGCSGSGKSTFASSYPEYVRIERNRYREFILGMKFPSINFAVTNIWEHWKWKWEDEVTAEVEAELNRAAKNGLSVIVSDTNLDSDRRSQLVEKLEAIGYDVSVEVIGRDLDLETLWKRDLLRKNSVGHSVIAKQYEQFRKEFPLLELKDVSDKQEAVIFDVDGTLAHMEGIRGAYELDNVDLDAPDDVIIGSLVMSHMMGRKIIIMSGRDGVSREKTSKWLIDNINLVADKIGVDFDVLDFDLFMRPTDDMRSDVIIKRELFMEHVDGKYKVVAVFDDRPKVCRGWYDLGLKVIHCKNPWIEF